MRERECQVMIAYIIRISGISEKLSQVLRCDEENRGDGKPGGTE
jgi:hypothetical protein